MLPPYRKAANYLKIKDTKLAADKKREECCLTQQHFIFIFKIQNKECLLPYAAALPLGSKFLLFLNPVLIRQQAELAIKIAGAKREGASHTQKI
jgi:hypothetical protein